MFQRPPFEFRPPSFQLLYSICVSIWLVPLYVLSSFSSTLFLQLAHTLKEYFEEMAEEIAERNSQVRGGHVEFSWSCCAVS